MNVAVEMPEELGHKLADSPAGLGRRIALDLPVYNYSPHLLSLGKAAELSGLSHGDFEKLLAERTMERNYSVADLAADWQCAKSAD